MPARLLLVLAVLVGCAPDSNYTLSIDPITPANVTLGLARPDATLVHRVGMSNTLYPLGPLEGSAFTDLPPLEDGAIGLLLTEEGTASETYVPTTLLGYGEAPLGGALASGKEQRVVTMLVTEFAGTGDLGVIPQRDAPLLGAAALLPSGAAYTFGGVGPDNAPHAEIRRLADIRSGDWDTSNVGTMPDVNGSPGVSALHTATPLDDGTILVTGGRPVYFAISNNSSNAFIWDPSSESAVWQASNGMNPGRSRHQAVKLLSGRVLLFGGWQGQGVDSDAGTFQIFNPEQRRFQNAGTTQAGALGANVTALGGDGALACGGFRFELTAEKLLATETCERISLNGDVIPFPNLPVPLSMAATAALPDGRVLVAGGVIGDIDIPFVDGFLAGSNIAPATDRAWLYEPGPGAWREIGQLSDARAGAVAVPSGDGRFVIIGGAAMAGAMISEDEGAVFCPELFDPDTEAFTTPGSCATPSSGAFPLVSTQPGLGAFVVEGHLAEAGAEAGGQAYGIIGLAPPL